MACLLAACSDPSEPLGRAARYGVFADLVVYRRPIDEGGPFFLDRFETTRRDWWHSLEQTDPEGSHREPQPGTEYPPAVRVNLYQARRFAHWRLCRLPQLDEWAYAATGRGGYDYPWGNRFEPAWVNEAELGLGRTTPVGMFESGRDDEGAYDLLGNVAEWTESVDPRWFSMEPTTPPHDLPLAALDFLNGLSVLKPWRVDDLPWPGSWWVAAAGSDLPRLVVGGHFLSFLRLQKEAAEPGAWRLDGDGRLWERGMGERGDTVGIRLATDPVALISALAAEPDRPTPREVAQLRSFLRRPEVAEVLVPALQERLPWTGPSGPLLDVLREELQP